MGRPLTVMAALAVSLAAIGCSGSDDASDATGGELGPYPEGPYGSDVGATVENLQWQGYVNHTAEGVATEQPFVAYSMDDVRRSGKAYAVVHLSEFY